MTGMDRADVEAAFELGRERACQAYRTSDPLPDGTARRCGHRATAAVLYASASGCCEGTCWRYVCDCCSGATTGRYAGTCFVHGDILDVVAVMPLGDADVPGADSVPALVRPVREEPVQQGGWPPQASPVCRVYQVSARAVAACFVAAVIVVAGISAGGVLW